MSEAREWVLQFVHWYNSEHRHSGLNFLTPNQSMAQSRKSANFGNC
ncbi:integrase core domain-containing protein [Aneurinibacillus terranovensis]